MEGKHVLGHVGVGLESVKIDPLFLSNAPLQKAYQVCTTRMKFTVPDCTKRVKSPGKEASINSVLQKKGRNDSKT